MSEDDQDPNNPLPDEVDIDLDAEDTAAEAREELGTYPTVEAYLQAQLEVYLHSDGLWLLDCLDMARVLARFECGGRFTYHAENGRVFRTGQSPAELPQCQVT